MDLSRKFIWILDSQVLSAGLSARGLPTELILPRSLAPSPVTSLLGARIWLCIRDKGHLLLFALLHLKQIDQFEEGLSQGDYLLAADFTTSFRITAHSSDAVRYDVTNSVAISSTFFEVNQEVDKAFRACLITKTSKALARPHRRLVDLVPACTIDPTAADFYPVEQIKAVVHTVSLSEISWKMGSQNLPPFANLAFETIAKREGILVAESLKDRLVKLDPFTRLFEEIAEPHVHPNGEQGSPDKRMASREPEVDLDFQPIDPQNIFARKFIARKKLFDDGATINKTERAEKEHQEILRSVTERLIASGYKPLQSTSLDLVLDLPDRCLIFEIKSGNSQNIFAQAAKGMFQILSYEIAVSKGGRSNPESILIIGSSNNNRIDDFVRGIIARAGCLCLFFKGELEWPDKLAGLSQILQD